MEAFSGILAIAGVAIAVVWILFPFLAYGELRQISHAARESAHYLKFIAECAETQRDIRLAAPSAPRAVPPPRRVD